MSNIYLGIQTTTTTNTIVVFDDEKILEEISYPKDRTQNTLVLNSIDKILKKNSVEIKDVSKICIVVGEGAYTGTRIGVSIANTFAFALGIKLIGITNKEIGEQSFSDFLLNMDIKNNNGVEEVFPIYSGPPIIT